MAHVESLPRRPRWLRPAGRADDNEDDPDSPTPPWTVLLDPLAYIDGERNATTAAAAGSNGSPIQVTFWIARPPRVSHLAVHCPGLPPDAFPELPLVVATDDDLALIHISVSRRQRFGDGRADELFVYRAGAGGRPPLLLLIPDPQHQLYHEKKVGILSRRADDKFFLAALVSDPYTTFECHTTRYIHLLDSETLAWSTKLVHVDWPTNTKCSYAVTNKVITIGGRHGSIGWVDLWHGILVYDVLRGRNNDELRFIPPPSPPESDLQLQSMRQTYVYADGTTEHHTSESDLEAMGPIVRDITGGGGVIKYFAMYSPGVCTTDVSGDWQADTWRMKDPWVKWQQGRHLKASKIMVDHTTHSGLLPEEPDDEDTEEKPVLTRLRVCNPLLSRHDDDVVYILTKPMHKDHKACVIAVDIRNKAIQGVDEFDAGRTTQRSTRCIPPYTQTDIFRRMGTEVEEEEEEEQWIGHAFYK
ncbi:hypothetical protein VPH35_091625 [Triticum aestivum]